MRFHKVYPKMLQFELQKTDSRTSFSSQNQEIFLDKLGTYGEKIYATQRLARGVLFNSICRRLEIQLQAKTAAYASQTTEYTKRSFGPEEPNSAIDLSCLKLKRLPRIQMIKELALHKYVNL